MSEVDFAEVRDAGTGIAEIADSVQAGHDDVADGINGGADVAGQDYADAGGATPRRPGHGCRPRSAVRRRAP